MTADTRRWLIVVVLAYCLGWYHAAYFWGKWWWSWFGCLLGCLIFAISLLSCQQKNTKPCEIPPDGIAVVPHTEMQIHDYCECESNGKWFRAESNGLCYAEDAPQ